MVSVQLLLLGLVSSSAAVQPREHHIFVDAAATDTSSVRDGGASTPFGCLFEAQKALRAGVGSDLGITKRVVHVRGSHHLAAPLVLTELDAGTATNPIVWRGEGANPRMSGGIPIPAQAFTPFTPPSGATGVVAAKLFPLGFNATSLGEMGNPHPHGMAQLYVDGKPMLLARSPNIADDGTWMWYGYEHFKSPTNTAFVLDDPVAAHAMIPALNSSYGSAGLWIHGFFKFDWRDTYIKIDSVVEDGTTGAFTVTNDPKTPPQYPFTAGARFYAVGSLEFLDQKGEYYIDKVNGMLYFYPLEPLAAGTDVVVSHLPQVLSNTGASHTTFENLVISDATGDVVQVENANNVTISDSTVSNGGGACMAVSGSNNTLAHNTIFGCGGQGISVSSGDVHTLEHGGTSVVGNTITNFSLIVRTYQAGIGFSGVGLYVANNTLTHAPHTAITGGGNDHLFEYNTISHACFECTDTGAFYVGRSWSQRGNIVRYNVFDTIRPTERLAQKSCSQNAFYLDDEMSGYDFYGNTIINSTTAVLLGGGRHNKIHGNTFIANDKDIAFDDRGMTWQLNYCRYNCTSPAGPHSDGKPNPACFLNELESIHYQSPPYSTKYPELIDIYNQHPCVPVGNSITDNTYCHTDSANGGEFLSATPAQIESWMSTASGNVEKC